MVVSKTYIFTHNPIFFFFQSFTSSKAMIPLRRKRLLGVEEMRRRTIKDQESGRQQMAIDVVFKGL